MRGPREQETVRARVLRSDPPGAEARLWAQLRARRLAGFKFVRQAPIGPFFADFCCRAEKLVVEVDGATHSTESEIARDARRTAFMTQAGYRVVRFTNEEIYRAMDGVVETVLAALERRDTL